MGLGICLNPLLRCFDAKNLCRRRAARAARRAARAARRAARSGFNFLQRKFWFLPS